MSNITPPIPVLPPDPEHGGLVDPAAVTPVSPGSPVSPHSPGSPDSPLSPGTPVEPSENTSSNISIIDATPETLGFPVQDGPAQDRPADADR